MSDKPFSVFLRSWWRNALHHHFAFLIQAKHSNVIKGQHIPWADLKSIFIFPLQFLPVSCIIICTWPVSQTVKTLRSQRREYGFESHTGHQSKAPRFERIEALFYMKWRSGAARRFTNNKQLTTNRYARERLIQSQNQISYGFLYIASSSSSLNSLVQSPIPNP